MRPLITVGILFFSLVPFAAAKIVWMSNWEIYIMDDDGDNIQRLTNNTLYDAEPRWSPNGKYIAFVREQERVTNEQNIDLFIMNIDGTQVQKLTTYTGIDVNPAWSPDSQHIAFTSTRGNYTSIHTIDIETRRVQQLTRNNMLYYTSSPTWSPDGEKIAYIFTRRDPFEDAIYVMDANGKNPRRFVHKVGSSYFSPQWSPDGKHLLYIEARHGKDDKVVIRSTGGILVKELMLPSTERWMISLVCWMGTRHVLIHAAGDEGHGQSDIFRYTIATDEVLNLTSFSAINDGFPDWIHDTTLGVLPIEKLTIQWGLIKQIN